MGLSANSGCGSQLFFYSRLVFTTVTTVGQVFDTLCRDLKLSQRQWESTKTSRATACHLSSPVSPPPRLPAARLATYKVTCLVPRLKYAAITFTDLTAENKSVKHTIMSVRLGWVGILRRKAYRYCRIIQSVTRQFELSGSVCAVSFESHFSSVVCSFLWCRRRREQRRTAWNKGRNSHKSQQVCLDCLTNQKELGSWRHLRSVMEERSGELE